MILGHASEELFAELVSWVEGGVVCVWLLCLHFMTRRSIQRHLHWSSFPGTTHKQECITLHGLDMGLRGGQALGVQVSAGGGDDDSLTQLSLQRV